jgi:glycosyltransferase involved in cell wall biosynthesis
LPISSTEELPLPGRLAIVVLNFPAPEDRRVWALATAAAAAGWDVTVISPALRGHRPGEGSHEGIRLRWFRASERVPGVVEAVMGTAAAARAVLGLGLRPGDVLHVCTPPDSHAWLLAAHRRRGVGTLYDQHDVVPLLADEKAGHRRLKRLYDRLEAATVRASTAVVTAGQIQADRLRELYSVAPIVVRTAAPWAAAEHEPPDLARRLGYLGVLGEQDGVDRLVQAAGMLKSAGRSDITIRIAGDGPELARLRRLAADLGVGDTVEFCGWLQESELEGFLHEVDGFVVPDPVTPFNDTCPMLKVSHALSAGLPLVMTPLKENLALTGGVGFVATGDTPAELADAILAWADSDKEERARQGAALRGRWRSELDPAQHMPRYVAALVSAVDRASPAPTRA